MKKYEYVKLPALTKIEYYDALGAEGWELIAVYDGYAYFKRPLTLLDKL